MTSTNTRKRKNGTDPRVDAPVEWNSVVGQDSVPQGEDAPARRIEPDTGDASRPLYVPTLEEIESELWDIATGEGSESSRVSALRALADIMGLTKPAPPDFPEGMTRLLDALAEGLGTKA